MDLMLSKMKNLCRICENESNFIDLSHPDYQCYVDKLLLCANVTFEIDDKLPKHLCGVCKIELENAYNFKEKCENSHKKFQQLFTTIKEETINLNDNDFVAFKNEINDEDAPDPNPIDNEDSYDYSNPPDLKTIVLITKVVKYEKTKNHINKKKITIDTQNHIEKRKSKTDEKFTNDAQNHFEKRKSTNVEEFICDICNKTFHLKFALENHMRIKHKMAKNLCECHYCGKFVVGREFTPHLYMHEKPFKCDICSWTFSSKQNLRRHIIGMHIEIPKRPKPLPSQKSTKQIFKCNLCDKAFVLEKQLEKHKSKMQLKYKCNVCCSAFKANYKLQRHILTHLSTADQELYNLQRIKKKQERKEKLTKANKGQKEKKIVVKRNPNPALANKEKVKKFLTRVCQFCGKVCTTSSNFFQHKLSHGIKRYKCEYCVKCFKTNSSYRKHVRVHTGEKPYKCEVCPLTFSQFPHLQTHKRIHTGEKPYKCDFCEKTFAQKNNCKKHMRVHTGEKPYQCDKCEESYIELNSLKRHKLKHHSE